MLLRFYFFLLLIQTFILHDFRIEFLFEVESFEQVIRWCNTRSSILLFFDYTDKDICHYRNHLLAKCKGYLPGTRGM